MLRSETHKPINPIWTKEYQVEVEGIYNCTYLRRMFGK
jgi:hypothetical protein